MRMKNKRYLLLLLMVLPSMGLLRAQDDTQLSQYWAMPSYYNAGAAGIYEKLNLRAATRQREAIRTFRYRMFPTPGEGLDFIFHKNKVNQARI